MNNCASAMKCNATDSGRGAMTVPTSGSAANSMTGSASGFVPKSAVIFCAGRMEDYGFYQEQPFWADKPLVVCADGGYRHARAMGIGPNILLGDFDSLLGELPAGVETVRYPREKDFTDSQIAVEYCLERGIKKLILLGAMGSRMDHSFANLSLLAYIAEHGGEGLVLDECNEIRLVRDSLTLEKKEGYSVSFLPLTREVRGVTLTGFAYPLQNATLRLGTNIAVSNEFAGETATVTVSDGILLAFCARDCAG